MWPRTQDFLVYVVRNKIRWIAFILKIWLLNAQAATFMRSVNYVARDWLWWSNLCRELIWAPRPRFVQKTAKVSLELLAFYFNIYITLLSVHAPFTFLSCSAIWSSPILGMLRTPPLTLTARAELTPRLIHIQTTRISSWYCDCGIEGRRILAGTVWNGLYPNSQSTWFLLRRRWVEHAIRSFRYAEMSKLAESWKISFNLVQQL